MVLSPYFIYKDFNELYTRGVYGRGMTNLNETLFGDLFQEYFIRVRVFLSLPPKIREKKIVIKWHKPDLRKQIRIGDIKQMLLSFLKTYSLKMHTIQLV